MFCEHFCIALDMFKTREARRFGVLNRFTTAGCTSLLRGEVWWRSADGDPRFR